MLLEGFHTLLSFYGSIGNIMDGLGISKESALLMKLQELALKANTHQSDKRGLDIK